MSAPDGSVRMIRDSECQPHQLQHRFQQPLYLAQPQAKNQAQRQGGLDRQIGIAVLAAPGFASWCLPSGQSIRRQPQSQATTPAKSRFILSPVCITLKFIFSRR
jgi:hypothetical protein